MKKNHKFSTYKRGYILININSKYCKQKISFNIFSLISGNIWQNILLEYLMPIDSLKGNYGLLLLPNITGDYCAHIRPA